MNFYKIDLKSNELSKVIGGKSPEPTCSITFGYNPYSEDVDCQEFMPFNANDAKQSN